VDDHHRAVEVEQVRFVQPTLMGAGDNASARLRQHSAEKRRALQSVVE
jgi:hypothetical protein